MRILFSIINRINYFLDLTFNTKKESAYNIKAGYRHRITVQPFDDRENKDEYQAEVYQFSKEFFTKNKLNKFLDVGCGSGFKLRKHFNSEECLGIEIEPTLSFLKNSYPNYKWSSLNDVNSYNFELVLLSDVIEHLNNPDEFLTNLESKINFKYIIISSPDRDIVRPKDHLGPPNNNSHYREWNSKEFKKYLSSRYQILDFIISNQKQGTMLCLCKRGQ